MSNHEQGDIHFIMRMHDRLFSHKTKRKMNKLKLPKSKHKLGYTEQEVSGIIKILKINPETFWKKFGVNTCAFSEKGKVLFYQCDIETTILCCVEKRDKYFWEWD